VLVEVDVGMGRAGIQPGAAAVELASQVSGLGNIRFVGLQTWESHTVAISDTDEKNARF
jgi:D-serine deaminase-like pyridoxal phosphate-dependent protein